MADTTQTETATDQDIVLEVTEPAVEQVLTLRAAEDDGDSLGLRIEITGVAGVEFTYDLSFEPVADADPDAGDSVVHQGGLPVIVPADSIDRLRGATLDLPRNGNEGLVMRNPNRPNPLAGIDLELSGDVTERINQLLEQSVNPALAAHGGYAKLEGIKDDAAYVTMGGGCQGCAVSALTLRDGIEAAILEAIPEITSVVDATDHTAGANPFY
jgi:Fe/S biogenesis protein NfuA